MSSLYEIAQNNITLTFFYKVQYLFQVNTEI